MMHGRIENPFVVGTKVRINKGTNIVSTNPAKKSHKAGRAQTVVVGFSQDGFKPGALDRRGAPARIGFEGSCGYWSYVNAADVEAVTVDDV